MRFLVLKILKMILKTLARATVARYQSGIIGITGTVGKTSTKETVFIILRRERRVRCSSKSFNNEIGLPLAILGDWEATGGFFFWLEVLRRSFHQLLFKTQSYPDLLVLEYGIDRPGDMSYLLKIARPSVGILTAVGDIPVHVEFFPGPEAILREKSKLITHLPATGFAVLNADDASILNLRFQTRAHTVTFGFSEFADVRVTNFKNRFDGKSGGVAFKLNYGGSVVPVRLDGLLGRGMVYSAAAGAAVGLIFGMNLIKIAEALSGYEPPAGRMRLIGGLKGTTIIDDSYNASPIAMREALGTVRLLKAKRKIAVLADMLEIGKYTFEAHEAMGRLAAKTVDILFTVGIRGKIIAETARQAGMKEERIFHFRTVDEAGRTLQIKLQKGDLILVKASQAVRLEKVVKEVMAEPDKAEKLLVRQDKLWLAKPGMYDEEV
jgi:UDP-N-acetylmuramoyl-tripeptide--D-alanyl-D-alanine ligase